MDRQLPNRTLNGRLERSVPAIAAIFLATLFLIFVLGQPESFKLKFNVFGLLSSISFFVSLTAWLLIQRVKERTEAHMWFSLFLLCLTFWGASESLLRFSVNAQTAMIWAPVTTLGSVFMPISLYMFALAYTDSKRARQPLTIALLVIVSAFFITVDNRTNLLTNYDPKLAALTPWGYVAHTGPGYIVATLWLVILATIAVILLIRFRRQTIEPVIHRQVTLFIIAIMLPLTVGGFTDGILPVFNIVVLPPMTVMLVTLMGLTISYGIFKYQFFSFTPDLIASQILDTMNEAVVGVGPDLRMRYANAGAERLFGYHPKQFATIPLTKLFADHFTSAQIRERLFGALDETRLNSIDTVGLRKKDGSVITAKLSITKIVAGASDSAFIIVVTDITAIAQAAALVEHQVAVQTRTIRETKAQLDSSINSLELGFLITDDRPEVIMANRPAHTLFCGDTSHTPSDCRQVSLGTIGKLAGPKIAHALLQSLKSRRAQRIKLIEFEGRSWSVFITPVVDGTTATGAAIVVQDITEEQILNRSRDEFFSIASHELRTPLTAIKGGTSMILQYYPDAISDPSLHEIVDDIHESSERLIAIVNDFLDVSRLEQGRITYNLEDLKLGEIAERVVYEMGATVSAKGIYLKLGDGLQAAGDLPLVRADRNRLKQILFNLVGNAVKFTATGGITLDAARDGKSIKISVTDTGRGISEDMQPLLFHKFQQAGESILTRDAAGGTGLGLYISRLLADGMGGKLVLEHSQPGHGSVFSFTLPVVSKRIVKH